jgi:hypothetical protein
MATMAIGAGMAAAGGIISALNSAPSAAQLTLNSQLQDMTKFMQGQAKTEGIDASSVFQKVMGPLTRVLQGGPQQAGWSNAQVANWNAQAVQRGAAEARDLGAFANNNPGSQTAAMLQAKQKAEEGVSTGIAQGEQASATAGREEFNAAVGGAENATKAFEPANEAAKIMPEQEKVGLESQASVDAAKKAASWSGIASKALTAAGGSMMGAAGQKQGSSPSGNPVGGFAGGEQNLDTTGGSSPWEQVKNYGMGMLGKRTGPAGGTSGLFAAPVEGAVKQPSYMPGGEDLTPPAAAGFGG